MWLSASDSTKISGGPADDEKAQRRLVANYSMRLTLNRLVAILGEKRSADSDGRGDDDNDDDDDVTVQKHASGKQIMSKLMITESSSTLHHTLFKLPKPASEPKKDLQE